jgi:apolipoprotein N-acyltransferase
VAWLKTLVASVQSRRGFIGFVVAALLGALGVFGHAPFHIWPAFAVSICGLLVLMEGAAARPKSIWAGFAVTWSWAFGYLLAGMFWVGNAFLVDAEKFALLMPFAVAALPAGLAVFWGFGGVLALAFWRPDASRLLVFAACLSLAEFARGHLLTGLPWNLPAYIWTPGGIISQFSALIGPYGLSFITLFVLASPTILVSGKIKRFRKLTAVAAVLLIAAVTLYGGLRLNSVGGIDPMKGNGPLIAAGQGGYSQKEVWDPANASRVTQTYLDLLTSEQAVKADIVVWPEGTFPFLLLEQPDVLSALEQGIGERTLVLGSVRRTPSEQGDIYGNALLVFNKELGRLNLTSVYDKFHLCP